MQDRGCKKVRLEDGLGQMSLNPKQNQLPMGLRAVTNPGKCGGFFFLRLYWDITKEQNHKAYSLEIITGPFNTSDKSCRVSKAVAVELEMRKEQKAPEETREK